MTARKIDSAELREIALTGCTMVIMAERFRCKHETVRRWLRRDGLFEQWHALRFKSSLCEHCGLPSSRRFCSHLCWGQSQRQTISIEVLAPYIAAGTKLTTVARELKVTRGFVHDVLVRQGLYKAWAKRRYKKCASPTVGSTSATTAFAVVTTPSSRLEVPTDAHTNFGN